MNKSQISFFFFFTNLCVKCGSKVTTINMSVLLFSHHFVRLFHFFSKLKHKPVVKHNMYSFLLFFFFLRSKMTIYIYIIYKTKVYFF